MGTQQDALNAEGIQLTAEIEDAESALMIESMEVPARPRKWCIATTRAHLAACLALLPNGSPNCQPSAPPRTAPAPAPAARATATASTMPKPDTKLAEARALFAQYNALNGRERSLFLEKNDAALHAAALLIENAPPDSGQEPGEEISAEDVFARADEAVKAFAAAPRDIGKANALVAALAACPGTAGVERAEFHDAHSQTLQTATNLIHRHADE